jgi:hypothetical protein
MSEEITPEEITKKLEATGMFKEDEKNAETPQKEEKSADAEEKEVLKESVEDTASLSDVEEEATKKGWKPDGLKSADEFLRAEPLYEEIKKRGKEYKALKTQFDELAKHVSALKKSGYEKRLEHIQTEREEAIARSDVASVDYLDEELSNIQGEMQKDAQPPIHPAAAAFEERHHDILTDYSLEAQAIKEFIVQRDQQLMTFNLDPEVHIQTLEKDLQSKFPRQFEAETGEQEQAPAVESDSRPVTTKKKSKYTFADLSQDQKSIYKYMEKRGVMSGPDYIKQLQEIGELK